MIDNQVSLDVKTWQLQMMNRYTTRW